MPLYEYRCEHCAQHFDSYRASSERGDPSVCPGCGQTTRAERIWSTVAVRVGAGRARPRSGAEALAGGPVRGLGSHAGHARSSVLQKCGGLGHSH